MIEDNVLQEIFILIKKSQKKESSQQIKKYYQLLMRVYQRKNIELAINACSFFEKWAQKINTIFCDITPSRLHENDNTNHENEKFTSKSPLHDAHNYNKDPATLISSFNFSLINKTLIFCY